VRTTAYHDSSRPDSWSDDHPAIIIGGWEKPSGESQLSMIAMDLKTIWEMSD